MHIGNINTSNRTFHPVNYKNVPVMERIFDYEFAEMALEGAVTGTSLSENSKDKKANDKQGLTAKFVDSYSTPIVNVNFNIKELQDLAIANGYFSKPLVAGIEVAKLFDNVTKKILMLDGTHTFKEALQITENFIAKLGRNFYGVLFRDGDNLINPYHPLTAVAKSSEVTSKKYKILLYIYDDRELMDLEYYSDLVSSDMCTEVIKKLLIGVNTKMEEKVIDVEFVNRLTRKDNYTITTSFGLPTDITFSTNRNGTPSPNLMRKQTLVVGHQVLARGTVAPYYGTSILFRDSSRVRSSGASLTPFKSANISTNYQGFERVTTGSVCTGSTNGITLDSLATLNHANLSSPYTTTILTVGSLRYADECINMARKLYQAAGLLESYTPIEEFVIDYHAVYTKFIQIAMHNETLYHYLTRRYDRQYTNYKQIMAFLEQQLTKEQIDESKQTTSEIRLDVNGEESIDTDDDDEDDEWIAPDADDSDDSN